MRNLFLVSMLVFMSSCNVMQMLGGETKVPSSFYAYGSTSAIPPISPGGYININTGSCNMPSSAKILGAGFTTSTKLIIYAEFDTMSGNTTVVNYEAPIITFVDQGEIYVDLSQIPVPNSKYFYKLQNSTGAFSKGQNYVIECGP